MMKKAKKLTAIILCVMMTVLLFTGLTGCGSKEDVGKAGEPYLGTWVGTKASYEGIDFSIEDAIGGIFIVILNRNGSADVTVGTEKEVAKWQPTDNGIVLIEGDYEINMVASGSDLLIWDDEGVDIYVERSAD